MSESADTQSTRGQPSWSPAMEPTSTSGSSQSLIGPTVVIKGEVTAEENLLIMGTVEGFIDHSQTVTIHAQGTVSAEVKAQEVLIEGTVNGNVYGTKRVQIAESGSVNGNVYAPRVGVLEGASFKGAIDMDSDADAIERRFREKTGTESLSKAESKADKKAVSADKSSKDGKGDSNAAQADEKGTSKNSAGSTPEHG